MPSTGSIEDLLKPAKKGSGGTGASQAAPASSSKKATPPAPSVAGKLQSALGTIALEQKEIEVQRRAAKLSMPYVALRGFPIAPEAISLLTRAQANEAKAVVFLSVNDQLRLGTTEPSEAVTALAKDLELKQRAHVEIYLISEDSFAAAEHVYDTLPEVREVIYGYRIEQADLDRFAKQIANFDELQATIDKVNTSDILTLMIGASLQSGASDVHVEAEETKIMIRFRLDGILREAAHLPKDVWKLVISRLKLLAGVKINVDSVPQDGRITIYLTNEKVDIRVSFLPTAFGESVVMRLLRPKAIALEFDNLGVRGRALTKLIEQIEKPNGMIITTGPTGSGKTTTLYAILKKLNSPDVKIITLEDPVEYKLEGINQSQIDHSKDYDFAKGLRSILRQDPDVVMVGEIRDLETADIAVQAALTGHLVVSTIHTNSAAGAIPRFLSMGVKPFLLAPALNAVIGQRLVRRLCKDCKVPATLTDKQSETCKRLLGSISSASGEKIDIEHLAFFGPGPGCATCGKQGYKGRVGIYEIFTMSKEIEQEVLAHDVSEYKIAELAAKDGMLTMAQDGLLKALDGLTSVDEVFEAANTDASTPIAPPTAPPTPPIQP